MGERKVLTLAMVFELQMALLVTFFMQLENWIRDETLLSFLRRRG